MQTTTGVPARPTGHPSRVPPPSVAPARGTEAVARPAQLASGATRVLIPTLRVSAPATAVSLAADDALAVPDNPATVGWWMPQPSVLVIDGHVDSALTGPGALFELRSLQPGDSITVETPAGSTEHWRLDGLRTYTKGQLPEELFYRPGPRLVIVTCGGPFDYATHHYYDNVIAYASPTS